MAEEREKATPASECFGREDRILKRADYQRCYREGARHFAKLLTVHVHSSLSGRPRLGVTATRKVGGSVVRQKLRRRTREIYRRWEGRGSLPAVDIVVHLRPQAAGSSFEELRHQIEHILARFSPQNPQRKSPGIPR